MKQISSLIVAFAMFGVIFSVLPSAYSQTSDVETSDQITLSNDLLNDPLAQEILQKIEESKRKIAKLEQQNYDNLQAQKFLEERRAVALERLNQSLTLFEEEWYEFSPKVAYQKFIDKMPSGVQEIYAKQFEFTETKHELGVTAKTNAFDSGSDSPQAMSDFNDAAKSTVQELVDYNKTIQSNYVELTPDEQLSKRIVYWNDRVNYTNERIEKYRVDVERDYSIQLLIENDNERNDVRKVIEDYDAKIINRIELSQKISDIRDKYNLLEEEILDEKSQKLTELELQHANWIQDIVDRLMSSQNPIDSKLDVMWNSETNSREFIRK